MAEQRYQAVLAVIAQGRTVTEVAGQWEVSRQTLHAWLARYEAEGRGLAIVEVVLSALCVFLSSSLPLRWSRKLRPIGNPMAWTLLAVAALLAENFEEMWGCYRRHLVALRPDSVRPTDAAGATP